MKNPDTLTLAARTALRVLAVMLAMAAVLIALPGCGGDDGPDDDRATTGPVDCKTNPERCA